MTTEFFYQQQMHKILQGEHHYVSYSMNHCLQHQFFMIQQQRFFSSFSHQLTKNNLKENIIIFLSTPTFFF